MATCSTRRRCTSTSLLRPPGHGGKSGQGQPPARPARRLHHVIYTNTEHSVYVLLPRVRYSIVFMGCRAGARDSELGLSAAPEVFRLIVFNVIRPCLRLLSGLLCARRLPQRRVAWKPSSRRCGSGEYLRWPCVYAATIGQQSRLERAIRRRQLTSAAGKLSPCGARDVDARPGAGRRRLRGEAGHRRPVPVGVVAPHGRRRRPRCVCFPCARILAELLPSRITPCDRPAVACKGERQRRACESEASPLDSPWMPLPLPGR